MTDPKAGREFDAIIAERVMGWRWWRSSNTGRRCLYAKEPPEWFMELATGNEPLVGDWDHIRFPAFSTSISDAWLVVEKMRALDWNYDVRNEVDEHVAVFWFPYHYATRTTRIADSAPVAICLASLAALRAVEHAQSGVTNAGRQ